MNYTDLAYRTTAAQSASGLSLLIALYDALARDLNRAAAAQRSGDLQARGQAVKHALVVVGSLQNWIDPGSGELAQQLIAFYSTLRRRLIEAQIRQSVEIFEEQMTATLNIRAIWQRLEFRGVANAGPDVEILPPAQATGYPGVWAAHLERRQLSWSA